MCLISAGPSNHLSPLGFPPHGQSSYFATYLKLFESLLLPPPPPSRPFFMDTDPCIRQRDVGGLLHGWHWGCSSD